MFTRVMLFFVMMGSLTLCPRLFAQPAPAPAAGAAAPAKPPMKQEELDQLLAPIALYPDSLLSQMFMASTYPLEIVEADRWAKAHKDLKGDALAKELEKQKWDASVRSLVNFPDVLSSMSEKLDTTVKLGDAFLAQQADVMNTVQLLRAKAQKEGQLKTNEQQKVVVEPKPATTQPIIVQTPAPAQVIKIEPAKPQVIYVPTYEPTVVYGAWPYPSYPPYPYYPPRPPGYVATAALSFTAGVACGAAWGYAWGGCNWGGGDVDIDIDRNTEFNTNINRQEFKANVNKTNVQGGNRTNVQGGNRTSFQHDPSHRQGVAYRDQGTAQKFGGSKQTAQAAQSREQFRGRAEAGRQDMSRQGADQINRDVAGVNRAGGNDRAGTAGNRAGTNDRASAGTSDRASAGTSDRAGGGASRNSASGSGAFSGVDRGGSAAKADSERGASSRGASTSSAARGGGSSGGSGGRGGGGGGGGRR